MPNEGPAYPECGATVLRKEVTATGVPYFRQVKGACALFDCSTCACVIQADGTWMNSQGWVQVTAKRWSSKVEALMAADPSLQLGHYEVMPPRDTPLPRDEVQYRGLFDQALQAMRYIAPDGGLLVLHPFKGVRPGDRTTPRAHVHFHALALTRRPGPFYDEVRIWALQAETDWLVHYEPTWGSTPRQAHETLLYMLNHTSLPTHRPARTSLLQGYGRQRGAVRAYGLMARGGSQRT